MRCLLAEQGKKLREIQSVRRVLAKDRSWIDLAEMGLRGS